MFLDVTNKFSLQSYIKFDLLRMIYLKRALLVRKLFHSGDFMKLQESRTYIITGTGILLMALFISCAFPFQSAKNIKLSDISKQLGYHEISRQGFMGGSVFYNPDQPSSGQLVEGAHVAVRLGRVDRHVIDGEQSVFTDKPDEALYGYITVNAVNKDSIGFTYTYYLSDGNQSFSSHYTIQLNETTDINGDGLADLTYTQPSRKRPGMENALYLTFLSSQEYLNTAMFAVLPEQYSRSVYPSGIIGINIDGKLIVSKYESNTPVRSSVQGIINGDFVLDTIEGDYKRVAHTSPSRSARSISDSDLEDIESSNIVVSFKFVESDFGSGYDVDTLFSALPDTVKELYFGNETTLQKLNHLLENRDLIILVSKAQDTSITEDKFVEIATQIAKLSDNEVVQINRLFLDMTYPNICPEFINASNNIAEILGLAVVVIGGDLDEPDEYSRAATKVSSSADYDSQLKEINNWYGSTYKDLWTKTLSINPSQAPVGTTLKNSFIKIGMRGIFTCVWGHIGGSIEGVVFLNTDTNLQSTASFNKELFKYPSGISVPIFAYGPIILRVGGNLNTSINLQLTADLDTSFKFRAAFAGIYGAGIEAGVKYGTTTKKVKILFITLKMILPYIDTYSGSWTTEKAIYYVVADSPANLSFKTLRATLTPQIQASIEASISNTLWGNITAQEGLPSSVNVKYEKPYLIGTAEIRENRRLYAEAGVGININIPILGPQKLGVSKKMGLNAAC
jgi:hypothetical protein